MKQSKLQNIPPSLDATPEMAGPRYRYFLNPPSTVTLRVADLARAIPEQNRAGSFDRDRPVEVPCETILSGPAPRVALSDLANLIPECFSNTNFTDVQVALSAKRIALAYHMVATVEQLPEPEPIPEPVLEEPPVETPAENRSDEVAPASVEPEPEPVGEPTAEAETPLAPEPEPPAPEVTASAPEPPSPPEVPPPPSVGGTALSAEEAEKNEPEPASRRPFSILPIFRRRTKAATETPAAPEVPEEPAVPAPRARVKIPKPRAPQVPLVPSSPPEAFAPDPGAELPAETPVPPPSEETAPPIAESPVPAPLAEPVPDEVVEAARPPVEEPEAADKENTEAVFLDTEHLSSTDERALEQIPVQDGLQAIFMTEEQLGIEQVLARCGGLPGVQSCILSHGNSVLAAHHVPEEIDLVSLSAHAVEMLAAMRTSSAKMGIGAVPAVTVHSEKGPITFFNQEDVCLLVLHKDRGFVPGVREKLQQVVEELSRANLPRTLPGGESGPKSRED